MNKIILISCVLSIALSVSAPQYGFIGCQNDAKNCSDKGTCSGVSGLCQCTLPAAGFNCAQAELTVQPNDFAKCKAELAKDALIETTCKNALDAKVVALNWKTGQTFTAFENFAITYAAGARAIALVFSTDQLINALDNLEFQYVYSVYDNRATTPVTTFDLSKNKGFAGSYTKAIQNMVQAYAIANTFQANSINLVSDEAAKNSKKFAALVGTWASAVYAIHPTKQDEKLGVASISPSTLVANTIAATYGKDWTTTLSMSGYIQVFQKWGNPAVALKVGSLYSALLLVFKVTQQLGGDAKSNTIAVAASADFTDNKQTQTLVFSDTKIDTNYKWALSAIDLSAGETTTATACVAEKCTATATVASGSQVVYIYTEVLSNYLISFSLILSALTLSL